ncbi:hypothetical protein VIGAN_02163600 [Vigna angularis var. angularis]|uniref:Glucosamine/galactosamine-6-phosphate isomerase domain-containing protein n=1 Tax=Vigna angularis var. angularis TaxID=157739 RepID=A0A0S3REG2_PHAAN|nr:hypothetical protein VIGAN_02163600 [Vigna angularis var. angularis]
MTETNSVAVEVFEKEDIADSLAKYVADLSNKFNLERRTFTFCLSGGSLIKKLLEPLYVDSLEWSKWQVFWMDDSNYYLALDGLLSKIYCTAATCVVEE